MLTPCCGSSGSPDHEPTTNQTVDSSWLTRLFRYTTQVRGRDEDYVIDLCDGALNLKAKRHHRFDFLRGDPGKNSRCAKLPVDAYYDELKLVIEYRERQHAESVPIFDKRLTCSGCDRREQRRRYDQRRRDVLPKHGIHLIELEYNSFQHNGKKRLTRNPIRDEAVIRELLADFLPRK